MPIRHFLDSKDAHEIVKYSAHTVSQIFNFESFKITRNSYITLAWPDLLNVGFKFDLELFSHFYLIDVN